LAKEQNITLAELSDQDFLKVDPNFVGKSLRKSLGVQGAVESYRSLGSSGPEFVAEQIALWKNKL
jgi:argininosuccinate lyase